MINGTTSSSSAANTTATSGSAATDKAKATLGKDDFLKLLVAQLKNQDPLNPSDPTQFTAQLAQFSSLEQLTSVNENLAAMAKASNNSQDLERLSAFSMIGRQVQMKGPDFKYSGAAVGFGYTLDTAASSMAVKIVDSNNQVVAMLPQASCLPGAHEYSWDGTKMNGAKAAVGDYHLVVERTDNGKVASLDSHVTGAVDGVNLGATGAILTTSVGDFTLADVLRVTGT